MSRKRKPNPVYKASIYVQIDPRGLQQGTSTFLGIISFAGGALSIFIPHMVNSQIRGDLVPEESDGRARKPGEGGRKASRPGDGLDATLWTFQKAFCTTLHRA